jgi:hypothetical protein
MTYTIAADELKKTLPGYTPAKSEAFHRESARLADNQYTQALKERSEPVVILMAGGTASGKSEYVSVYLQDNPVIVLDGTLPTFQGARIKITKALKAKKLVEVHCVLPESLIVAFIAFLNRDRKFSTEHFFRTHSSARKTLLEVARTFPDVKIKIIISDVDYVGSGSTMSFQELFFEDHIALIEFLQAEQYTEESIKQIIFGPYDT